jgi:hypothetical protein
MTARNSTRIAPAVPEALGASVFIAVAPNGFLVEGLVWFAVLAGVGALLAFGSRFKAVRLAREDGEDERDELQRDAGLSSSSMPSFASGCSPNDPWWTRSKERLGGGGVTAQPGKPSREPDELRGRAR